MNDEVFEAVVAPVTIVLPPDPASSPLVLTAADGLPLVLAKPELDPAVREAAEQYVRTQQRQRPRGVATALAVAALFAAFMPPRDTGRVVIKPQPKTPERLSAAEAKRDRKATKRLSHQS